MMFLKIEGKLFLFRILNIVRVLFKCDGGV